MKRLTHRDRRALAIGGLVIAVAAAGGRGIPLWVDALERARDDVGREQRALADAYAVIAAAPALRNALIQHRGRYLAMAPAIIAERAPADAAARLGSLVSVAATSAGVSVGSMSVRADSGAGRAFARPSVRGEARGDISGLAQFLLLIELGPQLMRVSELTVTQPDPVGGTGRAEELRIAFVVEGVASLTWARAATARPVDARRGGAQP